MPWLSKDTKYLKYAAERKGLVPFSGSLLASKVKADILAPTNTLAIDSWHCEASHSMLVHDERKVDG